MLQQSTKKAIISRLKSDMKRYRYAGETMGFQLGSAFERIVADIVDEWDLTDDAIDELAASFEAIARQLNERT